MVDDPQDDQIPLVTQEKDKPLMEILMDLCRPE
jgi:hypothetical protein